jgi:CRISPR/Cas system-associated exonuclease Cas4 (RecB family)
MSLSYSQLKRYRTCPRQYEFAHVKKIPWGISEGESFGASVHVALKKWGEMEMKGRGLGLGSRRKKEVREDQLGLFTEQDRAEPSDGLTEEKLLEIWHQSFVFDTYATRFEADFARKRGGEIMQRFFRWWAQAPHEVLGVEKAFTLDHNGLEISGRLDRIEGMADGVRIVDFKTSVPCSQEEADADLQLSVYALAVEELFHRPCHGLTMLFLSEDGVIERSTVRSASQLQDARTQIRLIRERMEAKDFHPTPGRAICRRCPYRGICDVAAA